MVIEVAKFTPKAPVSTFEVSRRNLDTVFETIFTPPLYAEIDALQQVFDLRATSAVITSARLTNSSAQTRTVDFQVRSSRRITYQAEVTAQAGENWLRLDRVLQLRGASHIGWDWSQTPPVRLNTNFPLTSISSLSWSANSRYLASVDGEGPGGRIRIYDRDANYASVYISDTYPGTTRPFLLTWSPTGLYLAVAFEFPEDGVYLRVFDFSGGFTAPPEVDLSTALSRLDRRPALAWGGPGNRYLIATGGASARITVWDWNTGSPVFAEGLSNALSTATSGAATAVAFPPSTAAVMRLAIGHTSGDRLSVFTWPSATTVSKDTSPLFAANTSATIGRFGLAWSPDGRLLAATAGAAPSVPCTVYDFAGAVQVLPPPTLPFLPPLRCVVWSGDNRYLVLGHDSATPFTYYPTPLPYLLLLDYATGTPVRVLESPALQAAGFVGEVRFSPDGEVLMVGGRATDPLYPPTGIDNVRLFDEAGDNLVVNGSFENTEGMTRTPFGFSALGSIVGWFTDQEPQESVRLLFPTSRFVDAFATDGSVYLSATAQTLQPQFTTTNPLLRQNFSGLVEGATYRVAVDVTASLESSAGVSVLWNGTSVDFNNETRLPIVTDSALLSVSLPPGGSLNLELNRHMLAQGDAMQARADGAGVSCAVAYILATQEAVRTVTEPPEPEPEV
jgi:WD40 repeat protein